MARISIDRVAKVNTSTNRLENKILVVDSSGNLVTQTQIIETDSNPSISDSITNISGVGITLENLSSDIVDEKLTYTTSNNYTVQSLSVFYNGLLINKDIGGVTQNSFTISSDYQSIISSGDSLLVIYTKK